MILTAETKQRFNRAYLMIEQGWSLQYALKSSGIMAYNEKQSPMRKTEEFKKAKDLYMKLKYNKGEQDGLME